MIALLGALLLLDVALALPRAHDGDASLRPEDVLHPAVTRHHRGAEIHGVPGYKGELPSRHFGGYITVDRGGCTGTWSTDWPPWPSSRPHQGVACAWMCRCCGGMLALPGWSKCSLSLCRGRPWCPASGLAMHPLGAACAWPLLLQSAGGTFTTTLCSLSAAPVTTRWCSGSTAALAAAAWTVRGLACPLLGRGRAGPVGLPCAEPPLRLRWRCDRMAWNEECRWGMAALPAVVARPHTCPSASGPASRPSQALSMSTALSCLPSKEARTALADTCRWGGGSCAG